MCLCRRIAKLYKTIGLGAVHTGASSTCKTGCINASRVKIGGRKKTTLSKKHANFTKIRRKFISFVEIWGICHMYHWLRGDGHPCVHKVRQAIFPNVEPLPCHTLSHISVLPQ